MSALPKNIKILTLGCRLNSAESERLQQRAGTDATQPPTIIINTCAVTSAAVREARQLIRREKRRNPDAQIWVTGCAADTEPHTFTTMAEVTRIVPNGEKNALFASDTPAAPAPSARARAYLPVQNGCNHRCTFCIIPYGRGPSRSLPLEQAVREAATIVESGARELVLTGVDLTSWGEDLPGTPKLGRLVREILRRVPALPRLRLSSIDAAEIDPELEEMIAYETRLMPHLHLSLQAGNTMILKRMKRRHSREQGLALCHKLKQLRADMVLGADLIAGFPTESDAMFADTLRFVDEAELTFVHAFSFSPREGTPAARMPQLPHSVVKARASALRAAGAERLRKHLARKVGASETVLCEHDTSARCADFTPVQLDRPHARGALVGVRFAGHDNEHLSGMCVETTA